METAGLMLIVERAHLAPLAHQQRVLDLRLAVARHRIPGPLDVAQRSLAVVAFEQLGALDERVRDVVRCENRRTARPRMDEGRLDRRAQVGLRRHVGDAVMGEDGIKDATEPQRPHVAGDVLALGIAGPAERQHRLGDVGERAGETRLEMRGVVAGAGAQFQQRGRGTGDRIGEGLEETAASSA